MSKQDNYPPKPKITNRQDLARIIELQKAARKELARKRLHRAFLQLDWESPN